MEKKWSEKETERGGQVQRLREKEPMMQDRERLSDRKIGKEREIQIYVEREIPRGWRKKKKVSKKIVFPIRLL